MASSKKNKPNDTLVPAAVTPDLEPVLEIPMTPVVASQPAAPVVLAPPSPKYRVKSNCKASFFGQPVHLHKDDIVDSSGYGGASGIKRFIESGADLEEIK